MVWQHILWHWLPMLVFGGEDFTLYFWQWNAVAEFIFLLEEVYWTLLLLYMKWEKKKLEMELKTLLSVGKQSFCFFIPCSNFFFFFFFWFGEGGFGPSSLSRGYIHLPLSQMFGCYVPTSNLSRSTPMIFVVLNCY